MPAQEEKHQKYNYDFLKVILLCILFDLTDTQKMKKYNIQVTDTAGKEQRETI